MTTVETEQMRFMRVAYNRALRVAQRVFRAWHSRKREDAIQECLGKLWSEWAGLIERGRDPEPLLPGLIKYAVLFVRYDRRIAGRAPSYDVYDYRAGMKRQQLSGQGQASPTDRSDPGNGWLDWAVRSEDDPAQWVEGLDAVGLTSDDLAA